MRRGRDLLLTLDGVINLVLGIGLVVFPRALVQALGIPTVESAFYPSVLGGVLVGVGIALLVARFGDRAGAGGLGLTGAVAINLCGGLVLAGWLTFAPLALPLRGLLFLWALVLLLVGLSAFELAHQARSRRRSTRPERDRSP